ncbi:heat shock protein Hsp20 [Phenylobacterium zucineum HLK1]|uniref:Heat shock protein Hsp20 n=1 Tax=Phenylobacterium zucineum (strain HLK1) TaxID=450851 RepID=B4RED2_PHEZH|nr:Hsp20/alpha crystallin family protein [Phenylobacterium zucineum]ACG76874.1 heat shock protein Hsp20 [Phenylobacterium zucineum HLK1]
MNIPTPSKTAASVRSPFQPFQRELSRFFDELESGWEAFTDFRLAPSMDVAETKEGMEISLELPGLSREDVKISMDGDLLTVSGEKKAEREEKDRRYRLVERSYGEFSRSVRLPRSIDPATITAAMADGVLRITGTKRPDAATKTIEIQAS